MCAEIRLYHTKGSNPFVFIEAGWLIKKSNWRPGQYGPNVRENIAKKVGQNHAVGQLIEMFCLKYKIKYRLVIPKGKVRAPDFRLRTGWKKRTNQEQRDAAMLIWGEQ